MVCITWEYTGLRELCSGGVYLEYSRCSGGPVASQAIKSQSCKSMPLGMCQEGCLSWGSKEEFVKINAEVVFMQCNIHQKFGNLTVNNY